MEAVPVVGQPLLKPEEVSRFLRVTKEHVYRLAREGKLPSVRVGRSLRFRSADIHEYLAPTKGERHGKTEG